MRDTWPAPGKLNLFLHILGRRPDGYHRLQTIYQLIDYCDYLHFSSRTDGQIRRLDPLPGVAATDDLCVRAAVQLQQATGCRLGVDIGIEKNLPMGAGLGGGSSDAATTLHALNRLWYLDLPMAELAILGGQLGADVPVFLHGKSAWAEGVGEQLEPLVLPRSWYVVIVPPCHISTRELFQVPELTRDCQEITIGGFLSGQGGNVFAPVVRRRYPEVDQAWQWLSGFAPVRLSGTGSCIFAVFESSERAQEVLHERPAAWGGFVARALNRSPLLGCG